MIWSSENLGPLFPSKILTHRDFLIPWPRSPFRIVWATLTRQKQWSPVDKADALGPAEWGSRDPGWVIWVSHFIPLRLHFLIRKVGRITSVFQKSSNEMSEGTCLAQQKYTFPPSHTCKQCYREGPGSAYGSDLRKCMICLIWLDTRSENVWNYRFEIRKFKRVHVIKFLLVSKLAHTGTSNYLKRYWDSEFRRDISYPRAYWERSQLPASHWGFRSFAFGRRPHWADFSSLNFLVRPVPARPLPLDPWRELGICQWQEREVLIHHSLAIWGGGRGKGCPSGSGTGNVTQGGWASPAPAPVCMPLAPSL